MTNPTSKILVKDITKKINISRKELMNEPNEKPFIFKGYKNETDRIKDKIKENRSLFNLPDYEEIEKQKKIKSLSPINYKGNNIALSMNNNGFNFILNKTQKDKYILNNSNNNNEINNIGYNSSSDIFNKSKYSFSPLSRNITKFNKQKIEYYLKNNMILQPLMRFKPRTDLERIYDSINGNYLNKKENKIIERQLKHINLYNFKTPNDLLKKSRMNYKIKIFKRKHNKNPNNKEEIKRIDDIKDKPWIKASDLNIEAEDFLKSYHYKTHFKATEEIAENKNKKIRTNQNSFFYLNNNNKNRISQNYFSSQERKDVDKNKTFNYNDDLYDDEEVNNTDWEFFENKLNIIPKRGSKKKDEHKSFDDNAFNIIKTMAFKGKEIIPYAETSKEEDIFNKKINNKKSRLLDENSLLIGNKVYNKKNQFNLIAKNVLKSCNFYSNKSKFNNSSLKGRSGKTMITKGLSIAQFEKKYGLHE